MLKSRKSDVRPNFARLPSIIHYRLPSSLCSAPLRSNKPLVYMHSPAMRTMFVVCLQWGGKIVSLGVLYRGGFHRPCRRCQGISETSRVKCVAFQSHHARPWFTIVDPPVQLRCRLALSSQLSQLYTRSIIPSDRLLMSTHFTFLRHKERQMNIELRRRIMSERSEVGLVHTQTSTHFARYTMQKL